MSSSAPPGNMSSEEYQIEEEEGEESSVPNSKRTKTSIAWDYFEKFVDDKGLPKAKCKNCGKVYMARENGGTSNMRQHAKKCCVGVKISSYPPLDQEKLREKISGRRFLLRIFQPYLYPKIDDHIEMWPTTNEQGHGCSPRSPWICS